MGMQSANLSSGKPYSANNPVSSTNSKRESVCQRKGCRLLGGTSTSCSIGILLGAWLTLEAAGGMYADSLI